MRTGIVQNESPESDRPTKTARAPRPALLLIALGAIFALAHARPMGPVGMALFLAGVLRLELWPRRTDAGSAISVQRA